MNEFFVIYLINDRGLRGYLCDTEDGIKVQVGGISGAVTQFSTFDVANAFIRKHKLERLYKFAFAKSSEALMDEKENGIIAAKPDQQFFFIEGTEGRKCFFDAKTNNIYFTHRDAGYVAFSTIKEAEDFLKNYEFNFEVAIKPMPKKSKK